MVCLNNLTIWLRLQGRSWGPAIRIRDDTLPGLVGYPSSVLLDDGSMSGRRGGSGGSWRAEGTFLAVLANAVIAAAAAAIVVVVVGDGLVVGVAAPGRPVVAVADGAVAVAAAVAVVLAEGLLDHAHGALARVAGGPDPRQGVRGERRAADGLAVEGHRPPDAGRLREAVRRPRLHLRRRRRPAPERQGAPPPEGVLPGPAEEGALDFIVDDAYVGNKVLAQPVLTDGDGPLALVLAPTRELAEQIHEEVVRFGQPCGVKSVCIYGGVDKKEQVQAYPYTYPYT